MASSDFWRDLAAEFQRLPDGWTLAAHWGDIVGSPAFGKWNITGTRSVVTGFEALARRAAMGVAGANTGDLFEAWLEKLLDEGFGKKPASIVGLCKASEALCKKLESRALQAEFEEKKRDAPENWLPLRAQYEAFKAAKKLTGGPHEEIPEALVRATLARQFGIKPEEVTARQINLAVIELLPYYPAIKLISPSRLSAETEGGQKKTVAAQLNDLKEECHLTVQEVAELVEMEDRSVRRHLSGSSTPYDRHLRAYEREFSKILNRKVVISKTS